MFLPQCEQQEALLVSRIVQTGSETHSPNSLVASGALFSGVKHLGHKDHYLSQTSAECKSAWSHTSIFLHGVVLKQEKPPVNVLFTCSCVCMWLGSVSSYKHNKR
jgi:hypothetical protein